MNFAERFSEFQRVVKNRLNEYFVRDVPYARLLESMRYSLLAGGKWIRPLLVLEFCRVSCGEWDTAIDIACGVEMLHTYSLIHDDLPCMDDDDQRRGVPSNHIAFGETTAVLAGDALQAAAFSAVLAAPIEAKGRAECAALLADAAGEGGICGGQYLDIAGEGKALSELELVEINERKTVSLIRAACLMGAVAGCASDAQKKAVARYAECMGMAFQIRDDMLDALGDEAILGKPIGSDERAGKTTFYTLFGREECKRRIDELTRAACDAVMSEFSDTSFLCELALWLAGRVE